MQIKKYLSILFIVIASKGLIAQDWLAYVPSQNTNVTVVDVSINSTLPVATITGFNGPFDVAITPDRRFAYVGNASSNTLGVIEISSNTLFTSIPLTHSPLGIAINPAGTKVYVVTFDGLNGLVVVVDIPSNSVETAISIPGQRINNIAITPDGKKAFVSSINPSYVTIIDLSNNTITATLTTGFSSPLRLAVNPQGTKVIVPNGDVGTAPSVIDVATNTVTPINGYPIVASFRVAITPDGQKAFIVNSDESISVVNVETQTWITNIVGVVYPSGIFVRPDSEIAYVVSKGSQSVLGIDVATNSLIPGLSLPIDNATFYIVITPDQAPTAAFTYTLPSTFDASNSSSPTGSIATYMWDFGDGSPVLIETSPIITHAYAMLGSYDVTLTVVNTAGTSTTQTFTGQTVGNNGGPIARITKTISNKPIVPPLNLFPPTNLNGYQDKNRFLTQTEYFNVLKWNAPTNGAKPVAYNIYRNSALTDFVAIVKATSEKLKYEDHNRRENVKYTYYIVSVDQAGNMSTPTFVAVPN